jgi:simple sugar transport system permease protein
MNSNPVLLLLMAAVLNGAPLLFSTVGEILSEKAGNLNLGVEGMMYMGGAMGLGGAFYYEMLVGSQASGPVAVVIAILCAFFGGVLGALIYSFLTITLRANQNVTGLALAIFGTGVGQFIGEYMRVTSGGYVSVGNALKNTFSGSPFPAALRQLPIVGPLLFGHNIFVYLGVVIAVVMGLFLKRSRTGLFLRAVGESPATADAAGINVNRYKYLATVLGGGISAIGGMVYIMTISGCVWNHEGLSGEGWLAVALVIFCLWRPLGAIWGSILFGALMILYLRLPLAFLPDQLYRILPYVMTVIVLIFTSMRNSKDKQPPASLGLPYFREDR